MTEETIRKLAGLQRLPSLPAIVFRLTRMVMEPGYAAEQVGAVIQEDAAVTARVLKAVNSVHYGVGRPMTRLEHAIVRLGHGMVRNIVLTTTVFSALRRDDGRMLDRAALWRHNTGTGVIAEYLGRWAGPSCPGRSADLLYLCGLLHDLGKIVFEEHFNAAFTDALGLAAERGLPLIDCERLALGTDHAEVGGWLAGSWNLPPPIVAAIAHHHDPAGADPAHRPLAAFVQAANMLAHAQGLDGGGDPSPGRAGEDCLRGHGLDVAMPPDSEIALALDRSTVLLSVD